jgi:large subunit ribosomal protein L29
MTKRADAIKAVRDMGDDELFEHIRSERRRLFDLRFQQATGQVENHRQLRYIRREIARSLTVRTENARAAAREAQVSLADVEPGPSPAAEPSAVDDDAAEGDIDE